MKKFANARQLKREIDSYVTHFTGAPLVVGIDDTGEYAALLNELYDDPGKQSMHMSDRCDTEFPPDPWVGRRMEKRPSGLVWPSPECSTVNGPWNCS